VARIAVLEKLPGLLEIGSKFYSGLIYQQGPMNFDVKDTPKYSKHERAYYLESLISGHLTDHEFYVGAKNTWCPKGWAPVGDESKARSGNILLEISRLPNF